MSASKDLQKALRSALIGDAAVAAFVGARVLDKPRTEVDFPYITFGPLDFDPIDPDCIILSTETRQIDVWSSAVDGKAEALDLCRAVKAALQGLTVALDGGGTAEMTVALVRVLDDPQPGITHGVITVECQIEE